MIQIDSDADHRIPQHRRLILLCSNRRRLHQDAAALAPIEQKIIRPANIRVQPCHLCNRRLRGQSGRQRKPARHRQRNRRSASVR